MVQLSGQRRGKSDSKLLTPHPLYNGLGKTEKARQAAYQTLFNGTMPEQDINAIRHATNKAWVLGDERFKTQIAQKTGRRAEPLGRGGDRKSAKFRENQ